MKRLFCLTFLLFTTSCKTNLHQLSLQENALKREQLYSSYLALEYLDYARNLAIGNDWSDSEYFSKKGLAVGSGVNVVPENPRAWNVDPLEMEDAIMSQKRLEAVSTDEMKQILPTQLAHLFMLYDCWISKETKPIFKIDEMSRCKVRFYKLVGEIEQFMADMRKDRQPRTIITEDEFVRFEIRFDFDKYNFNDKANKQTVELFKYLFSLNGNYRILLVGNADRVAKTLYNETLARKRVETVRNYLIRNGVARDLIFIRAFGENFPDIITKDEMQHQLNRTVGIYVLKGIGTFEQYPVPLIENTVYKRDVLKARAKRGIK